jgi:hypothetical protein
MIIDAFIRDQDQNVIAICGKKQVPLTWDYITEHKPQVGDEIVEDEPTVETK